jgi:D-sedoheptulose 7-phosphate isomerase
MSLEIINKSFNEHEYVLLESKKLLQDDILRGSELIITALHNGNTIFLCGNGGSAADAQHIAAEFTGRFVKERAGLPAIALTTDTSALTAIGNDYGYIKVFSRQLEALGKAGDVLIAISTSGNSENILNAIDVAKQKHIIVIGLSGKDGGIMKGVCDYNINVPSSITARIQEMHILIGHMLCELVDAAN